MFIYLILPHGFIAMGNRRGRVDLGRQGSPDCGRVSGMDPLVMQGVSHSGGCVLSRFCWCKCIVYGSSFRDHAYPWMDYDSLGVGRVQDVALERKRVCCIYCTLVNYLFYLIMYALASLAAGLSVLRLVLPAVFLSYSCGSCMLQRFFVWADAACRLVETETGQDMNFMNLNRSRGLNILIIIASWDDECT